MSTGCAFAAHALAGLAELRQEPLHLLAPRSAPDMMKSSPHLVTAAWLHREFGWSAKRRMLLDRFEARLQEMREAGVQPVCALVGGSMLGDEEEPGDLDALVVYRISADNPLLPGAAEAIRKKSPGLDLRFVPEDAGPVLLLKMSCFFHTLYQGIDKGLCRASAIVIFEETFE